jgi:hypothetical protein
VKFFAKAVFDDVKAKFCAKKSGTGETGVFFIASGFTFIHN